MIKRVSQYLLIVVAIGVFYYLLSHHFLISSITDFDILKKSELTLEDTFVSMKQVNPEELLRNDALRNAGIEYVLLDRGMISNEKLDQILQRIDKE